IVKVNNQIEEKKKKQEKVNNDITISQKQLDNLVETNSYIVIYFFLFFLFFFNLVINFNYPFFVINFII
ncbi:hypothetical protein, partial [Ligilactobacillus salivarius]|uniref:hypothetical protein n=1 Tax=Ligilactobacillus salivarius TaxID=1624 RepID=UPI00267107BE